MDVTRTYERPYWRSKLSFVLASAAAGAGFGSFFRFPAVAYQYGGGSFVYLYVVCLLVMGTPVLMLELALGQIHRQAAPGALEKVCARFRGVGLFALMIGFVMAAYFCVVASWVILFVPALFKEKLHYDKDYLYEVLPSITGNFSSSHITLIIGIGVEWIIVFIFMWKGVKSMGVVSYFTIPAAFTLVILLCARVASLDGAWYGIRHFLVSDYKTHPFSLEMLTAAASQGFLSVGVGTGVMPAFGSYNRKSRDVVKWSFVVTLVNLLLSVICGVAVFAVIGNPNLNPDIITVTVPNNTTTVPMIPPDVVSSLQQPQEVLPSPSETQQAGVLTEGHIEVSLSDDDQDKPTYKDNDDTIVTNFTLSPQDSGFLLVYATLPQAVSKLPTGASHMFAIILFAAVLTLGIDTAFSYSLSLHTYLLDSYPNAPTPIVSAVVCLVGFSLSFCFTFHHGPQLLEVINFFLPTFGVLGVIILECICVGFFCDKITLKQRVKDHTYTGIKRLFDFFLIVSCYSIIQMQHLINEIGKVQVNRFSWCILIKYLVPSVCSVLWVTSIILEVKHRLTLPPNRLVEYPIPIMAVGWLLLAMLPILFAVSGLKRPTNHDKIPPWTRATDNDELDCIEPTVPEHLQQLGRQQFNLEAEMQP